MLLHFEINRIEFAEAIFLPPTPKFSTKISILTHTFPHEIFSVWIEAMQWVNSYISIILQLCKTLCASKFPLAT